MKRNWLKRLFLSDTGPAVPVDTLGVAKTGSQSRTGVGFSAGAYGTGLTALDNPLPRTYATYRTIRKHPTIALARAMSIAPIVAAEWSVEERDGAPSEAKEFIESELLGIREDLIQKIAENGCDFGWSPFEKVFHIRDGFTSLRKLKPLLPDITTIMVDKSHAFQGFQQPGDATGALNLALEYAFNVPFRVEGTNWYGEALLENVREAYSRWQACDKGAERYDRKLAGSNWVVYYPPGSTLVGSTETDNCEIAAQILAGLESSGSVSVPASVSKSIESLNGASNAENGGWNIDTIGDQVAKQYSFVARASYLDKLLVRGLLMPERSLLEAAEGTRADASEHADGAIILRETEHRYITRHVNWHLVDQLLALNFGAEHRGSVWLRAAPIADKNKAFMREVYRALLINPASFVEMFDHLDFDGLTDSLGLPIRRDDDRADIPTRGMDRTDPLAEIVRKLYAKGVNNPSDPEKDAA